MYLWGKYLRLPMGPAGSPFGETVEAADVVMTKPGYGIVSQILSMGKRTVLTTGEGFPEEDAS